MRSRTTNNVADELLTALALLKAFHVFLVDALVGRQA
jgi:hypothetical protein